MGKHIVLVALGAISYGTLTSVAKLAYGKGYSAAEITFSQALLGAIILWGIVIIRSEKTRLARPIFNWKLLLAGTTVGLSAYCFYLSVQYIPVSLAIVLLMQVSWMSILGEWLIFKKKVTIIEVFSTSIIIVGTVLAGNLLSVTSLHFSLTGIFLALVAAVIYTGYVMSSSKLGNDVPMFQKSALMMTGSATVILLINFKPIINSTHIDIELLQWGGFLAIFGTVIPPVCFNTGMPKIGPGLSAILLTLELPAVVLCAHLILGEPVALLQILGIGIMIGAIIYLNLAKTKVDKQTEIDSKDKQAALEF